MQKIAAALGQNIFMISKYMKLYLKIDLKPYDLNTAEGMVLLALYDGHGKNSGEGQKPLNADAMGVTQEQINDQLHYDKGVMTRTMQALEQKSYVVREENRADGRSSVFFLTEGGQRFKPTLLSILRDWSDGALEGFSPEQLGTLDSMLNQLAENAKVTAERGKSL